LTEGRFHFMLYSIDLHIHSALSPCADDDMTPNNIVNMSVLKKLDIIAVTDHNSSRNCEAVMKCACSKGILALPGMELETREEVHLLCLFPGLEQAKHFQDMVYSALPDMENREQVFGRQIVFDENDMAAGTEKRLLLAAANLSLEEADCKI
jgi:predicted metal-dependent phosphoesterase TrpH